MSDVPAILIGSAIGAVSALAGGIVTEVWRDHRSASTAANLLSEELKDNLQRLEAYIATIDRSDGNSHRNPLNLVAFADDLPLSRDAWEAQRPSIVRARQSKRAGEQVAIAYSACEISDHYKRELMRHSDATSMNEWKVKCISARDATALAITELRSAFKQLDN